MDIPDDLAEEAILRSLPAVQVEQEPPKLREQSTSTAFSHAISRPQLFSSILQGQRSFATSRATVRPPSILNAMAQEYVQNDTLVPEDQGVEVSVDAASQRSSDQRTQADLATVEASALPTQGSSRIETSHHTINPSGSSSAVDNTEEPQAFRSAIPTQPRAATHTNSRTWVNPRTHLQARWTEVYKNLKDMSIIKEVVNPQAPTSATGSFCVPKTFHDWLDHRLEIANDSAREARHRLSILQKHLRARRHPDLPPAGETAPIITPPFGGRIFGDGRGSTLAWPTIWSPWRQQRPTALPRQTSEEGRPEALWPCEEEMREEGNERMTSGFRRFLGLPRIPGNDTVNWKQLKVLPMLPFDEVWKLPTAQTWRDQRATVSPSDTERMEAFIGNDLLSALECNMIEET